jgi:putative transposase
MFLADREQSFQFILHDRDSKFSRAFDEVFRSEDMKIVRTPIRAPNANAYAERCVGTLRRECLDRMMFINRRHLQHVLRLYTAHYNRHTPHRSLSLQPPDEQPAAAVPLPARRIHKRELLGGLINEYKAAA